MVEVYLLNLSKCEYVKKTNCILILCCTSYLHEKCYDTAAHFCGRGHFVIIYSSNPVCGSHRNCWEQK